jgi:L,D-transpeptidase ErfK/SrfK
MRKQLIGLLLLTAPALAALPGAVGQDKEVQVNQGQNLYHLAKEHGLALEHVAFANDLPIRYEAPESEKLVVPGRRILPRTHPSDGLLINLPERGVYLFKNDEFVGFYPIAIGKDGFHTPTGRYEIVNRVKNPTWIPPEWAEQEEPVPAGPDNPLGDRWIGISAPGIGIHATNDPGSIGGAVSHGCMRTYPELASELYEKVEVGMPVWVVYEPVKFGWSADQKLLVQVFPDVYKHNNRAAKARKIIHEEGLGSRVPEHVLQALLKQRSDGVTREIGG